MNEGQYKKKMEHFLEINNLTNYSVNFFPKYFLVEFLQKIAKPNMVITNKFFYLEN